ncbi:IclR family transcriptional regulator [Bradyrhizobium liaoningense]
MPSSGVAAVDRALSILAAFEDAPEPMTLAELARRTKMYKSTLLRLMTSLQEFGYLVQFADGRYHLGPTPFRLGAVYQRSNNLHDRVVPLLRQLVADGTESPSYHVRHDAKRRLCVFRVDSQHSTLDRVEAGMLLPLDRGAAGRVILAFDGEKGEGYDEIRKDCIAMSFGERDPDCAGLACPVFGPRWQMRWRLVALGAEAALHAGQYQGDDVAVAEGCHPPDAHAGRSDRTA